MSSDIISTLLLDKDFTHGRVILVNEINSCDSSFITSCVIGHQIKSKSSVLLITFHNTLSHYQYVGLKMNYNLKKCIESHSVELYNVGEDVVNSVLETKDVPLHSIFLNIKEKSSILLQRSGSISIIVDGLSHLFDLKYNMRDVNSFVRNITSLVRDCNNSFVLFNCNVACDGDVTNLISNLLSHMAYTVAEVVNLPTGLSADISGHLVIKHPGQKFEPENVSIFNMKPSCYHFKLFDRGVKLFAPGVL